MIDPELLHAVTTFFNGNEPEALHWLQQPQRAFNGKRPIDVDPATVIRLLGQLDHGVAP
jgi:uncharacterized protein (DUF2384 family)